MLPVACVLLLESRAICIKVFGTFPQCYWAGNALIRAGGCLYLRRKRLREDTGRVRGGIGGIHCEITGKSGGGLRETTGDHGAGTGHTARANG